MVFKFDSIFQWNIAVIRHPRYLQISESRFQSDWLFNDSFNWKMKILQNHNSYPNLDQLESLTAFLQTTGDSRSEHSILKTPYPSGSKYLSRKLGKRSVFDGFFFDQQHFRLMARVLECQLARGACLCQGRWAAKYDFWLRFLETCKDLCLAAAIFTDGKFMVNIFEKNYLICR